MSKLLAGAKFIDLLPDSIALDDTIQAAAAALDGELQKTQLAIRSILLFPRIDEIQEPLLSELAWQLHVDYWDPEFSAETKRDLIISSIPRHRRKGTPSAVEEMLRAVMGSGIVSEWFNYGGTPYHFRVEMDLAVTDWAAVNQTLIARLAETYKNVRSKLDDVLFYIASRGKRRHATALCGGEAVTVRPKPPPGAVSCIGIQRCMVGSQAAETITVYPRGA